MIRVLQPVRYCLVNGYCLANQAVDPLDSCFRCQSTVSLSDLTKSSTTTFSSSPSSSSCES